MFKSEELDRALKTHNTIESETAVYAEWNMNDPDNIEKLGNYRYRPDLDDNQFSILPTTYDPTDSGGYYTGATDSSVTIQSGLDDQDIPTLFTTKNEKMNLLYSLEECTRHHRPRSGINKLLFLGETANQYLDIGNRGFSNQEVLSIARRPRYYMSSRSDQFKYWTSYRTEEVDGQQQEFGVSKQNQDGLYYINDAVPFVVYKDRVPTNKIVIKMQTNVGDIDLGPFRFDNESFSDPLFGQENQTTPVRWSIEILEGSDWNPIFSFDQNSRDEDNQPIIKSDGYLEISYGLKIPFEYEFTFVYAGKLADESLLPEQAPLGYAFLIQESDTDRGILKIYDGSGWETVVPDYDWKISSQTVDIRTPKVTEPSNPDFFVDEDGSVQFREFQFIRGIRIVVETMNVPDCTFDLIEFSPRLLVDFSDQIVSANISKSLSDLANGSVPVGGLLASTGQLDLLDEKFSLNPNNVFNDETNMGSILAKYTDMIVKFNFYQIVKNIENFDYFIPLKTMYTEEIPVLSGEITNVSLSLRDMFFFLESSKAPEILVTDVSISYAVTLLLDYIGFSNCVFKRIDNAPEIIIPFFFVSPDQNVAEVLQQLALASQTAMFFDEYNNFLVMSKEFLLPENNQRETDSFLYGQVEGANLPNIINLSSEEKRVYNEGRIDYTTRYIQREVSKQVQANYIEKFKTYGYRPALLWEVSGRENLRTKNNIESESSGFSLTAAPLNSDINNIPPFVENNEIVNNVIDLGESVDFHVGAHQGYYYANGEIIRYDAIEYVMVGPLDDGLPGNTRWIRNNQEYQRYLSNLPFNGKIYPTGNLRIYAEPEYESVNGVTIMKNGPVKKHGRGQFGTIITEHKTGLDPYWSDNDSVKGCLQQAKEFLFNPDEFIEYPETQIGIAGKTSTEVPGLSFFDADALSINSTRNGVIKNFRSNKYYAENEINLFTTARVGTVQSSALVFNGPQMPLGLRPSEFVSYVYKNLDSVWVFDEQLQIVPPGTRLEEIPQEPGWFYINEEKTKKISPEPGNYVFVKNGKPSHFGTRMRIIGKIESTNQKSSTAFGAFPIYSTQDLNIDEPEKNIQILGGSGGLAFNLNQETNNGYYFEIVSLTQDNVEQYTNLEKPTIVSYKILADPAPSCVDNIVTVTVERNLELVVGQRVIISGMVDSLDDKDTRTPLNGEYKVVEVNEDGKRFRYEIPGDPIANRTSLTGATATVAGIGRSQLANMIFYKIVADEEGNAIPIRLWSGIGNILPDDGRFTGQYRLVGEENPTVFDVAAEYVKVGNAKRFFLYLNGVQVATVTDTDPLPDYNNMALFVRGSSRCMFENIYALGVNVGQNSSVPIASPVSKVWEDKEISTSESFRKYGISGVIQKTYLSGISAEGPPTHILYYDEFGTIMREAAYLNIKYDRAFPALYARLMKTLNRLKSYVVSGFYAGSYGADFLIFNSQDANINLDDTTGNFLRIQGITFTQNTTKSLTVDDFYKRRSTFSDPINREDGVLVDPAIEREEYNRILNSRGKYGINEFNISSEYIQTDDAAEEVFGWIIDKVSKPKILVGLNTFATHNLQLGDIIQINYKNNEGVDIIAPFDKRFVIYNIEYNKSLGEETMTIFLAEV